MGKKVCVVSLLIVLIVLCCLVLYPYKKVYDIKRSFDVDLQKNDIMNYQKNSELFAVKFSMDKKDADAFLKKHINNVVNKPNIVEDLLISWGLDINKCDSIVEVCTANHSMFSRKKSINISYFFMLENNRYIVFCSCI